MNGQPTPRSNNATATHEATANSPDRAGAAAFMEQFLGINPVEGSIHETLPQTADSTSMEQSRQVFGYVTLAELGRGGMGVVYKARHEKLNRVVALKMVLAGSHAGVEQLARFQAEATAVAQLHHPNIVDLYEIGEHDGHPYFAMEFIDGPSLAQYLAKELFKPKAAAALVAQLAEAIAAAHQAGIIHRDLKPANVLLNSVFDPHDALESLTRVSPKITDFGLAKQMDHDSGLTQSGAVMGTPSYMAPEQAHGDIDAIGPTTDVYALGAILYEMLTGRPPFRGASLVDTLDQVRRIEPVPPSRLQAGIPRDLEVICLKCLQKEPSKRYPTALALASDLRAFIDERPITARPITSVQRLWRWCLRNPKVAGLLAMCAILFVVGTVGITWNAMAAREKAHEALLAKGDADRAAWSARQSAIRAKAAEREATHQLVRVHIASGSNAVENGKLAEGMLWYHKAWETDRELDSPDWPHRSRFAGLLGRLPSLQACYFHLEPVLGVCWHPSGRWLITRDQDRGLYLWDLRNPTGDPATMQHPTRLEHFALSPNGNLLVGAGNDGTAIVWKIPEGTPQGKPLTHPQPVLWTAFAPDSQRLATACADGRIRFWNVHDGTLEALTIPLPQVSFVTFDPAGQRILAATEANQAGIFDATTGNVVAPLVAHFRRHLRIRGDTMGYSVEPCFHPDGKHFVTVWNGIHTYQTDGGKSVGQVNYGSQTIRRIVFAADGRHMLVHSNSMAYWWSFGSKDKGVAISHPRETQFSAIHPSGEQVVTSSSSGKLHWRDPSDGEAFMEPLQHVGEIAGLAYSPGGSFVAVACSDGTARVWQLANLTLRPKTVPSGNTDSFALAYQSANEKHIYRFSRDGRWQMNYQPATETMEVIRRADQVKVIDTPIIKPMHSSSFSLDGRLMYMVGDRTIQIWDVEQKRLALANVSLKGAFIGLATAKDAPRVLIIDNEQFQVWDWQTGERIYGPRQQQAEERPEHGPTDDRGYKITRGDISSDGTKVVIPGGSYRLLRTYDLESGRVRDVPLHDGYVYRAIFAPNGRHVLTAASDNTARLWDFETVQPVAPNLWHPKFVKDATLESDGRTAITYSDGAVRVWDVINGDLLLPPLAHPNQPDSPRLFLSADGRRVISHYVHNKSNALIYWSLPEFTVADEHLVPLVGLFTGRYVDQTLGLAPLRDVDVRRDRIRYQRAFAAYHQMRTGVASK